MTKEELKKIKENNPEKLIEFGICPECETELFYADGCCYCPACGWSACK